MLCERCNQNNATLHVSEYKNGETKKTYLCNECARSQGHIPGGTKPAFENFLMGILEMALDHNLEPPKAQKQQKPEIACSHCKMNVNEFRKNGQFGCNHCYRTFEDVLENALKKMQPSNRHVGKIPKSIEPLMEAKREAMTLKKGLELKLKLAIKDERYEDAAKLRDQIKELGKEGNDHD